MTQQLIQLIPSSTTPDRLSPMRISATPTTTDTSVPTSVITTTSNNNPQLNNNNNNIPIQMASVHSFSQHNQPTMVNIYNNNNNNNNNDKIRNKSPNHTLYTQQQQQQHCSEPNSPEFSAYGIPELLHDHDVAIKLEEEQHNQKYMQYDLSASRHSPVLQNTTYVSINKNIEQQQQQHANLKGEQEEQIFRLHVAAQQHLYEFERKFERENLVKLE